MRPDRFGLRTVFESGLRSGDDRLEPPDLVLGPLLVGRRGLLESLGGVGEDVSEVAAVVPGGVLEAGDALAEVAAGVEP